MDKGDYHYYKAMFESFGREILLEFQKQYEAGLTEGSSKHTVEDIVKGAAKCFIMYINAKDENANSK